MAQVFFFPPQTAGGGGGGDATAANQVTQISIANDQLTELQGIHSDTTDIAADTGTIASDTSSIDSKLGTLGQKNMAGSAPVVIASDQSAIPVTMASAPLPTGAATEAKQDTQITNQGTALSRLSGSLVPTAYDQIDVTYVTVGNGIGQVETATYKLATVTVKTLTLSYDGSDRLASVVAS